MQGLRKLLSLYHLFSNSLLTFCFTIIIHESQGHILFLEFVLTGQYVFVVELIYCTNGGNFSLKKKWAATFTLKCEVCKSRGKHRKSL